MGNQIKKIGGRVGQIIQYYDTPESWNQNNVPANINQNIQNIKDLNLLLAKNVINLGCHMQLEPESILRNGPKVENSLDRGKVVVEVLAKSGAKADKVQQKQQPIIKEQDRHKYSDQSPQKKQPHPESTSHLKSTSHLQSSSELHSHPTTRSYNIVVTLSQAYELRHMLSSYTKQQSMCQQKRNSSQGKVCVVCLDSKPEQVLPCSHQYCKKCVELYVIKNGLKCPMCRKSYRESLANNVYQIVEWNEDFVHEMRDIFFGVLDKNNAKEVKKIRKKIEANDKIRGQQ